MAYKIAIFKLKLKSFIKNPRRYRERQRYIRKVLKEILSDSKYE